MALIYFFRHGQAGTRDDYDRLSPLGERQARELGGWIARQNLRFDSIIAGGLRRQRETAALALNAAFEIDPGWSEFDLDAVYQQIAPQLASEDPGFRQHWEELQNSIASGDDGIHRRWTPPDAAVVEAWIRGRFPIAAETWIEFNRRVREAGQRFAALPEDARIAIFTSATPISIWISEVLGGLPPERVLRFAGASLNTGITILSARAGRLDLFMFNAVPHLGDPALHTFR
jgi:broad specificity phosphatase PhoE